MRLIRLTSDLESAYADYCKEWIASGERFVPAAADPCGRAFADTLARLARMENDPPAPLVPAATLFLEDNGALLGAVDVRFALNEHLLAFGGHIGYGVRPSARGHGYASLMVRLCFPLLREKGIDRALITCDNNNPASARTIERLGGEMENMALEDGRMWVRRYWVDIPPEEGKPQ